MNLKTAFLGLAVLTSTAALGKARYTVTDIGIDANAISANGYVAGTQYTSTLHAIRYGNGRLVDIGAAGAGSSFGRDVNVRGDVVGDGYLSAVPADQAFLYSDGAISNLGSLGGTRVEAFAINDAGMVAGYSDVAPGSDITHAFVYSNGVIKDIGTLGGPDSYAYDINKSGEVTGGTSSQRDPNGHAFLYSGGIMHDIGAFARGEVSVGQAVNDLGQVAGFGTVNNSYRAFTYSGGQFKQLGAFAGGDSYAYGINNKGAVVGGSLPSLSDPATYHAFLYQGSALVDLNTLIDPSLGWELSYAKDINDAGQIVGFGNLDGQTTGFLLTPITQSVPEAPALPSTLFGLVLVSGVVRHRARRNHPQAAERV